MIETKQLCKSYLLKNKVFQALHNINLSIHSGEIFGFLGESGAGKSTLIRSFNFLEKPTRGEVCIDGISLGSLSEAALRKMRQQIGMIFQHFNLLQSRTVFDNIALPLELTGQSKQAIAETVLSLLEWVNLLDRKHHYPHQLSGGEKQRVAIARALATKPRILLCDEPTSALDPKSTFAVLNLLKEINQKLGVTIVIITHEMDVIKHICDRAAVLAQGQVIEQGTVMALFAKPQSALTRQLIQKYMHIELPPTIKKHLQAKNDEAKSRLVRFTFLGEESSDPLISTLVKKFDITINIIQANIENIQDVMIGYTICQLSGRADEIDKALASIQPATITAEVLGYV